MENPMKELVLKQLENLMKDIESKELDNRVLEEIAILLSMIDRQIYANPSNFS
ncbi:MAG: hypothetical protein QXQ19_00410 [Candidatus Aenigmatarchaeota archaeon]